MFTPPYVYRCINHRQLLKALPGALLLCIAGLCQARGNSLPPLAKTEHPTPPEPVQVAALDSSTPLAFNMAFMHGNTTASDLRTLLAGQSITEGIHRLDIYVNLQPTGRRDVLFKHNPLSDNVEACFTLEMLQQAGIDIDRLPAAPPHESTCLRLPEWVPQATVNYESELLRLHVSVPQIYLQPSKRGYIDPTLWDAGQTAGFLNYNLNLRRDRTKHLPSTNYFGVDMQLGINLGPWRLRNNSYLSYSTGRSRSFKSQNTYVQRDLIGLRSQMMAGQTYTRSAIFDSIRFMGVQMMSDDNMRPDSEQGYAPIIRGTAESNATVEIRQNGYMIYSTTVPPGPFAINDLAPSGTNGDLEITIIEADGSRRTLRQAFSSPPLMVREGRLKYDIAVGQARLYDELRERPNLVSGTMQYGITSNTTLAAGLQASRNFSAYSMGMGVNTSLGAFSLDGIRSSSRIQGQQANGTSLNLRYAKFIEQTGATVSINARRELSQGYTTLANHIMATEAAQHNQLQYRYSNARQRLDAYINQPLAGGSLYLNASYNKHWENNSSNSLSVGYTNTIGSLGYTLSYTRSLYSSSPTISRSRDNVLMLTLSIPLGNGPIAPYSYASITRESAGTAVQTGVTGMLPTEAQIGYSITANRNQNRDYSAGLGLSTSTSFARMNASYTHGKNFNAGSVYLSGSVVAHSGGVNLGQALGETILLAKVDPPVAGVGITSQAGITTGYNGYAVIPNATPYRSNYVSLDTHNAPRNAEFNNTVQQIVPTRGAIALVSFKAQIGRRIQFEFHDEYGKPMPFGAVVSDQQGQTLGMTDPRGRILSMVPAENASGYVDVTKDDATCRASYTLPETVATANYQLITLRCLPRPAAPTPVQPDHLANQHEQHNTNAA